MKTRLQLFLDKGIAKPVAYLLNFVVRVVGQMAHIDHDLDRDFDTVVVSKLKGMGSIIQATPLLYALREKYPNATIVFVSTRSNKAFLEQIDLIDRVLVLDDSGFMALLKSTLRALFTLIKIRPGVYIDLEIYSDFSTLFTLFSLSINRVGFYLRSSSFRMGIYTHMMFFNPRLPISQVYLQMASLLGADTSKPRLYGFEALGTHKDYQDKDYIVVNVNASDLRLERRWGIEKFSEVIDRFLKAYPGYEVFLVGAPSEREYTARVEQRLSNDRVKNMAGRTSITELIQLVRGAKLMLSNDTGPMHVAFCTRTPVVCLFGPCSPEQYGFSDRAVVIYKPVFCSPCVHDFETPPCNGNNVCMKLITVEEVSAVMMKLMDNEPQDSKSESEAQKVVYTHDGTALGLVQRPDPRDSHHA